MTYGPGAVPKEPNNNSSGEETPNNSGNQQVAQAAGNPRFKPGLDPDPNPKVVVRAVNPPVTPDQVVGMAETPASASLPDVKLEKIRSPRVQNKSIQGYLKAIEAKMTQTEKLMKDVVKLQNLQIVTEKELYERKRELYQNTFEEYLLDKTIDFGDGPGGSGGCTCINLPKKGGGFPPLGGSRPRRPGGGVPPMLGPGAMELEEEAEDKKDTDENVDLGTRDFGDDYAKREQEAFEKARQWEKQKEQETGVTAPGKKSPQEDPQEQEQEQVEVEPATPVAPEPLKVPRPLFDPRLTPPFFIPDVISMPGVPATPPMVTIPDYDMRVKTQQQELAGAIEEYIKHNPGSEFDVKLGRGAYVDTGHLIKKRDGKVYIHEPLSEEQQGLLTISNFLNLSGWMPIVPIKGGRRTTTVPGTSLPTVNPARTRTSPTAAPVPAPGANTINPGPSRTQPAQPLSPVTARGARLGGSRQIIRQSRPVNPKEAQMQVNRDMMEAEMLGQDPRFIKMLMDQGFNFSAGSNVMPRTRKVFQSKRQPGVSFETNMNFSDFLGAGGGFGQRPLSTKEILQQMKQSSFDQMYSSPIGPMPQASGGIGEMNLYDSGAKQYFRNISSNISIPRFGGGGFNLLNPMSWFSGDLKKAQDGELENVSNDTFAGKLYNRRKQQEEMMKKLRGYQSGGIVDWWNKGRNVRVPSENTATWRDLMADDAKQLTRTNKAFKSGAGGVKGWRPLKAFTPEMVKTGPTPAVRQAFERPVRAARGAVKPGHPLVMLAELIINELVNPQSTAVYDQITGPNAYYNDPAYRGPMPSQNLENAQTNMMSNSDNQQPQVMPLPPNYIQIPKKKSAVNTRKKGNEQPGIDIESTPFTRSTTIIDPGFGDMFK